MIGRRGQPVGATPGNRCERQKTTARWEQQRTTVVNDNQANVQQRATAVNDKNKQIFARRGQLGATPDNRCERQKKIVRPRTTAGSEHRSA